MAHTSARPSGDPGLVPHVPTGPDALPQIVARVRAGDTDAFRAIVRECGPMVRVCLAAHLRDHQAVEDLSQEVFVAAYWALDSWDPTRDFRAWLAGIARHKLMSHLRGHYGRKNAVHRLTVDIHEMLLPDLERCNPDADAVVERLRHCIGRHPEKDRLLIEARYFAGEAVQSIALRLRTTVSAVSSQLYRLRSQLRRCIEEAMPL